MRRIAKTLAAILLTAMPVAAAEATIVETPAPVTALIETTAGAYLRTKAGSFKLEACAEKPICLNPATVEGEPARAPNDGLPDGKIATTETGDIVSAWYGRPTKRYGHGVLGDAIEGGSLLAEDADGHRYELVLDPSFVFEDITPRLIDLDRDGKKRDRDD